MSKLVELLPFQHIKCFCRCSRKYLMLSFVNHNSVHVLRPLIPLSPPDGLAYVNEPVYLPYPPKMTTMHLTSPIQIHAPTRPVLDFTATLINLYTKHLRNSYFI